jgi:hypothetical protein
MAALAVLALTVALVLASCRFLAPSTSDDDAPSPSMRLWSNRATKPSPTMVVPPSRN